MPAPVIFIDYENTQPADLDLLMDKACVVKLFLGVNQKSLPTEVSKALQPLGKSVEYVHGKHSGRNAIDFLLTYRIGREIEADPSQHFYIVSKDRDFDSLVKHLRADSVQCTRVETIGGIFGISPIAVETDPRIDAIVALLTGMKSAKPRRARTLRSTISAKFGLPDGPELETIVAQLQSRRFLTETAGKVTYK